MWSLYLFHVKRGNYTLEPSPVCLFVWHSFTFARCSVSCVSAPTPPLSLPEGLSFPQRPTSFVPVFPVSSPFKSHWLMFLLLPPLPDLIRSSVCRNMRSYSSKPNSFYSRRLPKSHIKSIYKIQSMRSLPHLPPKRPWS